MHRSVTRLVALAAGIAAILSCDYSTPTGRFGSGISGGPTGTAPITPPTGSDTTSPFVLITEPVDDQLVNVGDSILVVTTFSDDRKLGSLSITGFTETGDRALGTFARTIRYTQVVAPGPGGTPFAPGQTSAIIRRYLQPAQPLDTTAGPMLIVAVGTDSAGNTFRDSVTVQIVRGPKVTITIPTNGDSVPRGKPMRVSVLATDANGVQRLTVHVQDTAPPTWPTPLRPADVTQTYPPGSDTVRLETTVTIPADAPLSPRGRILITATALNAQNNPGNATPVTVFVRATGVAPRVCFAALNADGNAVCQSIPDKLEMDDWITIKADGDGIARIGIIILDELGTEIGRREKTYTGADIIPNQVDSLQLGLDLQHQGTRISIIAFAEDDNVPPLTGFSMPLGTSVPITDQANALAAETVITHGRTFGLPRTAPGALAGDVAVDEVRGNVFVSNTRFNLLEVWSNATKSFAASGVAVGSQPWGLFVSNDPDRLLVGNSGATTVSRVCINVATCAGGVIGEVLSERIRTRNTIIFQVQFVRDPATGKINLIRLPDVSYSDRPQYIAQSAAGRVFFSTRPTADALPGTIRWLDPALAFPDPRQIWQYGSLAGGTSPAFAIFHADSIQIVTFGATSPISDRIRIFDHAYGTNVDLARNSDPLTDSLPDDEAVKVRAAGGDAEVVRGLDVTSLALTDTTFVAASGDRNWIGFGEGNTPGSGRVMMSNDAAGCLSAPTFFPGPCFLSPTMAVTDLVHNASERVFGLAIDRTGLQAVAHGLQTYVAAVDNPFHMRLDGVYDSFDNGAGVAYHPNANSTLSANADRVLFTATASGVIEIVDVAHYNNRGTLITKGDLYGSLRVTLPLPQDNAGLTCPGDPQCVVLKLYGLSSNGLVVIDLRAADIKPGP